MYRRKKKNNMKFFLITFMILTVSLVGIYISTNRKSNFLFLEKLTHEVGAYISGIFIPQKVEVEEELLNGIYQELEAEVNVLKEMLDLDISNYKFIHATVLERNDWYQELVINKGENDGISVDMAVVANKGLIGKVVKTTFNTSYVKLMYSNNDDMKISVSVKTAADTYHGVLDEYLAGDNLFIVNVKKTSEIEVGDSVYTSGLGGLYPSGIYIGKVYDITYDSLGLEKQLKVRTDTSYDNISYVTVIDRS